MWLGPTDLVSMEVFFTYISFCFCKFYKYSGFSFIRGPAILPVSPFPHVRDV